MELPKLGSIENYLLKIQLKRDLIHLRHASQKRQIQIMRDEYKDTRGVLENHALLDVVSLDRDF